MEESEKKIKVITASDEDSFERKVNEFIKTKKVLSINFAQSPLRRKAYIAFVYYAEINV